MILVFNWTKLSTHIWTVGISLTVIKYNTTYIYTFDSINSTYGYYITDTSKGEVTKF